MKFGVDSYLWSENFSKEDMYIFDIAKKLECEVLDIAVGDLAGFPVTEVKAKRLETDMAIVTTMGLPAKYNLISPELQVRQEGVNMLKELVDLNIQIGSPIMAGVLYAAWGYTTGKPRTAQEWEWSVEGMREVCQYAAQKSDLIIAMEAVNRFETHFINTAEDAVAYCKAVGTPNIKVHLDTFHMIREEKNFAAAIRTCGKEYLAYVHVCENDRGIPGTGLVPWKELFRTLEEIGYDGYCVIESFDPSFEKTNAQCAIWRTFAKTGEELATQGLKNLKRIYSTLC